jgi:opacity protein-like surface antigen
MRRTLIPVAVAALLAAAAGTAQAQRIEITPFVGYQFGGELAEIGEETVNRQLDEAGTWGLIFDVSITDREQVEIYYSSQGTDLDQGTQGSTPVTIDYLQIGAIREYSPHRAVNPYVGITLGATRFDVAGDSDTRFSGGINVGAKMIVSDHLGFRFDGRVFGIVTGSDPISCSDELCIGYTDDTLTWQYTINAGVIIHFGRK